LVRQARRHSPGAHLFGTADDTPTRWPASPSPWRDERTGGWAALQRDGPQRRPLFPPLPHSATTRRTRSRLTRLQACGPRPTLAVASGASASSLRLTGQHPSPPCHSAAVRPCTTSTSSCPVGRRTRLLHVVAQQLGARCPLILAQGGPARPLQSRAATNRDAGPRRPGERPTHPPRLLEARRPSPPHAADRGSPTAATRLPTPPRAAD
jgi:hypothetical protein